MTAGSNGEWKRVHPRLLDLIPSEGPFVAAGAVAGVGSLPLIFVNSSGIGDLLDLARHFQFPLIFPGL
jgi:hypothetical protein